MRIDKNIEIPKRWGKGRWEAVARKMSVGDSVYVEIESERRGLIAAIRRHKFNAVSRKCDKGFRVWKKEKI